MGSGACPQEGVSDIAAEAGVSSDDRKRPARVGNLPTVNIDSHKMRTEDA